MQPGPPNPEGGDRGAVAPEPERNDVGIGLAALLGLVSSGGNALLSIARSKVTAIVLGPVGVGMTAEVSQIVTMVMSPVWLASGPALVGAIAEGRARGDDQAITRAYRSATTATILAAIAAVLVSVVLGIYLLPSPWGRGAWPWTLLAAVGSLGVAWASVPAQTLVALGELRKLTIITLAGAALSTVLVVGGTWFFGLSGQFVAIAATGVLSVPITLALASGRLRALGWRPRLAIDRAYARRALSVGAASLFGSVGAQTMLFAIRWTLEAHGGPALNGQFQAAWAVGGAYFGLILTSLGNYAFPRFAAASDAQALTRELDHTLRFLFRTTPPVIILAITFRREIVELLYSHQFDPAIELMGVQLTGDFAKAVSWAHAGPLLYRGRVRAYLCTELLASGIMIAAVIPLVHRYGLDGVGYAYVITYCTYVVVTAVALRLDCNVPFQWRHLLGTAVATGALVAMVPIERRFPVTRWIFLAGAIFWLYRAGVITQLRDGVVARLRRARNR